MNGVRSDPAGAVAALRAAGFVVAPHVAGFLHSRLAGDRTSVLETAGRLSAAQLAGTMALPDPLPVTAGTVDLHGAAHDRLSASERRTLLVASVCVVDRTEVLLAASGVEIGAIVDGALAGHLTLVSGRFAIADPRMRALAHERASLAERTDAHAALAGTHDARGEDGHAAWHRSLSSLEGDARLAPRLLTLARRAFADGDAAWALAIARETASHAEGGDLAHALRLAGTAAMHAGHVDDAVLWLRRAIEATDAAEAARGLDAYATAVLLAEGFVPEDELLAFPDSPALADAVDTAAALFAERGSRRSVERMRSAGRHVRARLGLTDQGQPSPGALWCDAIALPDADGVASGTRREPGQRVTEHGAAEETVGLACAIASASAMDLAHAERYDAARRVLTRALLKYAPSRSAESGVDGGGASTASTSAGHRATPLIEAAIIVLRAQIDTWAGQHERAASDLATAALRLPVALPSAGIGVALSRRLDVLLHGRIGSVSAALADTAAPASRAADRTEALIDEAILDWRGGDASAAASHLLLASAPVLSGRCAVFPLPSIDEAVVLAAAGRRAEADTALEALRQAGTSRFGLQRRAVLARSELALAAQGRLPELCREAEQLSRSLPSVYERAMTELALGRAVATLGDPLRARMHDLAAAEYFHECGHHTMSRAARRAADHPSPNDGDLPPVPARRTAAATTDASPATWSAELTAREQEVAALVIQGLSNREVAAALHLAVRTVEVHLGRVFAKTGVRSRTELSYLAFRSQPGSTT